MNFDIPKKNRPKIHEIEYFDFPSTHLEKTKIPVVAWVAFILGGAVLVFHFIINPIFNLI